MNTKTKLLYVEPSKNPEKTYDATFSLPSGDTKTTSFGSPSASTYLTTGDTQKRSAYRARHKQDLKTNDPTRAGYLAYYLNWGDSTRLRANIAAFKKRFSL